MAGHGARAAGMLVLAAVVLAAVGYGVDVAVKRLEHLVPNEGIQQPEQRATLPPPRTQEEIDAEKHLREVFEKSLAETRQELQEPETFHAGGDVVAPVAIQAPTPEYTEVARRARIQGVVILEVEVDARGRVTSTRVLKGLPMGLDEASVKAVADWRFQPGTRRGEPVPVVMTLTIRFRLE